MAQSKVINNARGYIRVSAHLQEDGTSLETQLKRIQEHCIYKHWNLLKVYEDVGISGKDMKGQAALQELRNDLQKGEYIIIPFLSRLSRNTKDALILLEEFKEKGVNFVCLDPDLDFSTSIGEFIFTVLMAVHKLERENTVKLIKENMQYLSSEGKLRTKAAFGWKFVGKDKDMEPDPEQQAVIRKIIAMYNSSMSLNQIAQILNSSGDNKVLNNNKRTHSENPMFYSHTIKRILMDQGVIEPDNPKRKPLNQRLISHHKTSETSVSETPQSSSSNIGRFEGPGPLLDIIS